MHTLTFQPLLKRIRWGGRRLGTRLAKPIGSENDYAESWEIVDHGADQSIVTEWPYRGWSLSKLVAEKERELFGDVKNRRQFPLLVKFLDASDRLSVQVHPNDDQAKQFDPRENGKTEAWVIIDAAPGSTIYAGLKSGATRESFGKAIEAGTIEDCLHSFPARRGDCVFIPAGTVHAIGEGILLAEIQQSSDITFRLYDWGRVGTDGKPRQMHIAEALSCIDFESGPVAAFQASEISDAGHRVEQLASCQYFSMRRHTSATPFTIQTNGRMRIAMMLDGAGELDEGAERKPFPLGQSLLVPACVDAITIRPQGDVTVLETLIP